MLESSRIDFVHAKLQRLMNSIWPFIRCRGYEAVVAPHEFQRTASANQERATLPEDVSELVAMGLIAWQENRGPAHVFVATDQLKELVALIWPMGEQTASINNSEVRRLAEEYIKRNP